MSEKKKVGLDIARSSTLVQEYQVASWERNELPSDRENADKGCLKGEKAV